jgi:hypothetical protein
VGALRSGCSRNFQAVLMPGNSGRSGWPCLGPGEGDDLEHGNEGAGPPQLPGRRSRKPRYAPRRYPYCTAMTKSGATFTYISQGRLDVSGLRKHYLGPKKVTWPPLTTPRVASTT